MRFMIQVRATNDSESGKPPSAERLAAMMKFNEELVKAGILVSADGLQASAKGTRVKFSGTSRTVIEGPFDTRELIAGFWIFDVKSKAEAVEWVKKCPNPFDGVSEIEIRQIMTAEDFGDNLTPELKAQEERLRGQVAAKS